MRLSAGHAAIKQPRFFYYLENFRSLVIPSLFFRRRLPEILARANGYDREGIEQRVNYYNRLSAPFELPVSAQPFRLDLFAGRRNYVMDLYHYTRYFNPSFRLNHQFGDVTSIPPVPTIVKARPISADNGNSVLFNLNKVRHFVFVKDEQSFRDKKDMLVWRGNSFQEKRKAFLRKHFHNKKCDAGHARRRRDGGGEWSKPFLTITEQLDYKFILSIEGNDVATNLKWIMSSNSVCFMPRPTRETWFMEAILVPGKHYVMLRDDFADLDEKIDYYLAHPEEAEEIIQNAQAYVRQFYDEEREDIIALRVLEKYFRLSGQLT
jgi:hypothetical protein